MEFHSLGQVAREVSSANELWLALVLTHQALQALGPPQLAGGPPLDVCPYFTHSVFARCAFLDLPPTRPEQLMRRQGAEAGWAGGLAVSGGGVGWVLFRGF